VTTALVRPLSAVTWELRTSWASGRRVALTLEGCDMPRLEGIVTAVASSGAFARVRGLHVPTDNILAIHWPSILGDGNGGNNGAPRRVQAAPGQTSLPLSEARA
jgi:hypothetical protein